MARVSDAGSVLAVIPARSGSKGIPNKNLALLAGLPLVGHAIRFAAACPAVTRTIVSTDSEEIARVAAELGAEVPFIRPSELARDDTPMWPVVRHALGQMDATGGSYAYVLLLDPTSPVRDPVDVGRALGILQADPRADGVVSVAEPGFNPVWQCVVERDGYMVHLVPDGTLLTRRQDAPRVYYIDGSIYLWRTSFVRSEHESWFVGRLLMHVVESAGSIDTQREFERLEALVASGFVSLPWCEEDRR